MKNFTRVTLIIAGCALVLGGVISLGVGAFTGFNYDRAEREERRNNQNYVYEDISETFTGEIKDIDFSFGNADITIEEGDTFSFTGKNVVKDSVKIDRSGDRLTIKQKSTDEWLDGFSLFNWDWNWDWNWGWHDDDDGSWGIGWKAPKITITIPAGTVFDSVRLSIGVGNTDIYDLKSDRVTDIDSGVGDTVFYDTALKNVSISGGVGNTTFKNSEIDSLDLDVGVGEFDFEGSISGKTTISGGVGNAKISGVFTGDISIFAGVGDLELYLKGNPDDYDFDVSNGLGDVSFNGRSNGFPMNNNAPNEIEIDGGVGTVDVSME